MTESITKKDLEEVLDKKFSQYQGAIIEAVDYKFQKIETEMAELRLEIRRLTVTLDNFLKQISDSKEEFIILKAEVDQIKSILQAKFGIKIAVQK